MNTSKSFRAWLLTAALLALACQAQAEDIDLFTGVNPAGGSVPTILLMMHNKSNTSASETHGCTYNDTGGAPRMGDTVTGYEQCAIVNALLAVRDSALNGKIKVGIMVFNNNNNFNAASGFDNGSGGTIGNGAGECGYLAYVPKVMNTENVDDLVSKVKLYDKNGSDDVTVSSTAVGDAMASAWAALNGLTDTCGGNNIDYSSLVDENSDCGGPVIVYIGNATTSNAKAEDATPVGRVMDLLKAQLTNKFGYAEGSEKYNQFTADIPVALIDSQQNKYQADDWARFMNRVNVADSAQADQNIRTYTIGVYDPDQGNIQDQLNYLGSMADHGGGEFYAVQFNDGDALQKVLLQIFTEVQAVNSVFSSATLPVSASTQGTHLNQVYIANFRPDRFAGPRWFGNVKQYKFAFDASGEIVLADQNQPTNGAVAATNSASGGFSDDAHSFWTTNDPDASTASEWPSTTGYWVNSPDGDAGAHDAPDGNLVEKGGVAQMARIDNLHTQANRNVLSCSNATNCTSLQAFNTTNYDESDFALNESSSNTSSVTITIGSDYQYSAAAPLQTMKVSYQCEQRVCTFIQDDDSPVAFPAFYTQQGNGNSAVDADTVGLASNDVTFPSCTVNSPCSVIAAGTDDQDGDGDDDPYFQIRFSDNAFKTVNPPRSISLTRLQRLSQRAVVQQTAHGLSNGEPFTLESCSADAGGNHINAGLIGSTFSETVESRISADAFLVAINGGDVAYSSGITCGGGSTSTLNADLLINWLRGTDNVGNEVLEGPCPLQTDGSRVDNSNEPCTMSVRPSIHGDVLHSRPAVINFGDLEDPNGDEEDIVLFYGSNDGLYRAVNGNQTRYIGNVRPGGELWSFVAPEFFGKLDRLLKDYPRVAYPGIPDDEAVRRDYFFDGSTAFLQDLRDTGDTAGKVYIYLTPRRGGKFIYAIDVTDPDSPAFLWKKSKSDFAEFGELWSTPQIATIEGHSRPVLIFGAGYDADVEDLDPVGVDADGNAVATDEGRGVFVLDAHDGSLVWAVLNSCAGVASADQANCVANSNMTRSFASDIKLFDNDFDGNIDRLYAADLGANIWRIDIPASFTAPGDWGVSKFASLGGSGESARKILFPPDVIPSNSYDLVVAVTGDREKPLYDARSETDAPGSAYNVDNRFYLLVDNNSGNTVASGTATISESNLVDRTGFKCYDPSAASIAIVDCSYDDTDKRYEDSSGNAVSLVTLTQIRSVKKGFYLTLEGNVADNGDSEGEKGVNAPTVVAGKVYFATNQPQTSSTDSCGANLGIARGYEVDFFTGESKTWIYPGGGLPATTTYGLVDVDGRTVPFAIGPGATPQSPITPGISLSGKRNRTYWYYQ